MSHKVKTSNTMNTGEMDLNGSPKPLKLGRGKTYSGGRTPRTSSGNLTHVKFDHSISISPKRRNSLGTLNTSVADRRKSRASYLNKKKSRDGAIDRKELIRSSMFSKVDTVFGEETSDAGGTDISSKNENSYLKRLLLSPSASSPGGRSAKKLNVDNCRLQRKKKPPKMKLSVPQIPAVGSKSSARTTSSTNKPKLSPTARTPEKNIKNKIGGASSTTKSLSKAEQNAKRLSADSTDTAPTEGSDSTDNDTLSAVTNRTAALTIDPPVDYSDIFYSFETIKVDVNFEAPSVERGRKVSFATQAQVASIADLINESAVASRKFQWEDLFYTEEELSDQRHEAFLEMCGLDEEF